ncbi:MAG: hypothetical protein EXS05_19545 [Planctomycetaceae bacterium]|nr:hypothetical protein [Planctomycetaceae bacterium]
MDPEATLLELLSALEGHDIDQVKELARALTRWLDHGGFPPKTVGHWKLGQDWHAELTRFICRLARAHVKTIAAHAAEGGDDVP